MAILDERTEFADATSIGTPNGSTVNVGDVIDSSNARDLGNGQALYLVVQVTTAFTSGGSAIFNFQLVSDATGTVATDDTQTIHFRSDDIPVASLVAGTQLCFPLPTGGAFNQAVVDYEQFVGFQVRETASQAATAGAVNAWLSLDPLGWRSYPDATN